MVLGDDQVQQSPSMIKFTKAHAYGNDFVYVEAAAVAGRALDQLARELCDRHTGIGADGLIVFASAPHGATMILFNADGGRAEVSGNGARGLAALLLRNDTRDAASITIHTEGGVKAFTRTARVGTRQTFRAAMGLPEGLRRIHMTAAGETLEVVTMTFGNPQSVVIGPMPDEARFRRLGPAIERHESFHEGTNVEFAAVESPALVRILIWERGVGPTLSSGTGSCAALIAAAAFGGASRDAEIVAPGGSQRVEWRDDAVYLTGWAEILFDGEWAGR
jgi:diaminopimelate epimerase